MQRILGRWFGGSKRWVVGVIGAALTTVAVGWLTGRIDLLREEVSPGPLVRVSVEQDPAVFDAASLADWTPYSYVIPAASTPIPPPPAGTCRERYAWAKELGGWDAGFSDVRVYLRGVKDEPVVIDQAKLHIAQTSSKRVGVKLLCPVGGASLDPLALRVDLDEEQIEFGRIEDGPRPFLLTLKSGEIEPLEIVAYSQHHDVRWWLELSTLWKDRRGTLRIDDHGQPFRTSGTAVRSLAWVDGRWRHFTGY